MLVHVGLLDHLGDHRPPQCSGAVLHFHMGGGLSITKANASSSCRWHFHRLHSMQATSETSGVTTSPSEAADDWTLGARNMPHRIHPLRHLQGQGLQTKPRHGKPRLAHTATTDQYSPLRWTAIVVCIPIGPMSVPEMLLPIPIGPIETSPNNAFVRHSPGHSLRDVVCPSLNAPSSTTPSTWTLRGAQAEWRPRCGTVQ